MQVTRLKELELPGDALGTSQKLLKTLIWLAICLKLKHVYKVKDCLSQKDSIKTAKWYCYAGTTCMFKALAILEIMLT